MSQSLDSMLLCYQHVRHIGEFILIAGLVGELLVLAFLHKRQRAEWAGSLIFTAVAVLGVVTESWAGGLADDIVQQMRAPRSLSQRQQAVIAERLKSFGVHEIVFFEVSDVDPEIAGITADLSKACASANWKSAFESFPTCSTDLASNTGEGHLGLGESCSSRQDSFACCRRISRNAAP